MTAARSDHARLQRFAQYEFAMLMLRIAVSMERKISR